MIHQHHQTMMGSHHKGRSIPKLLRNINSKPGARGVTHIVWRPFTQQDSGNNMLWLPLLTIKLTISMVRSVRLLLISLVCHPFFFIFNCSLAADRRPVAKGDVSARHYHALFICESVLRLRTITSPRFRGRRP